MGHVDFRRTHPHFALPFGALGAAVGWLSANQLRNPLVQTADALSVWVAAIGGGVVAAAVGAGLTRWARRDLESFLPPHPSAKWAWLVLPHADPRRTAIGALVGASTGYQDGVRSSRWRRAGRRRPQRARRAARLP